MGMRADIRVDAQDAPAQDHEDEVDDPDDVPADQDAQDPREDLPLGEPRHDAADRGRDGNDRQDDADQPPEPEIIAFAFCHDDTPSEIFPISILYTFSKKSQS